MGQLSEDAFRSPPRLATAGKEHAITSDDALDLPAMPKRIVIVGGGYIGMEFAAIFNGFGAEVHFISRTVRCALRCYFPPFFTSF